MRVNVLSKYALIGIFAVVAYYVFLMDSYPSSVEFQGYTLGSKQDNNDTTEKKLDIFSYRDKTNHHLLLFAMKNDTEFTVSDLLDLYLKNFKSQGVKFKKSGGRYLGVKADEAIYITESKSFKGVIVYVEKGGLPMPNKPSDGANIYIDMEYFTFQ